MNEIFSDFNGQRNEEKTLGIVLSETLNTSTEKEIEGIKHPENQIKFIYSEKAAKFCEISTLLLSCVVLVKSKVEISQTFVAFSEYMNFEK